MARHLRTALGLALFSLIGLQAEAAPVTFQGSATNPATGQALNPSITFAESGSDLVVTLSNVGADVLAPSDVLTAVFFDLEGNPALTGTSAVLASGATVLFGGTDPGGVVGGEWAYASALPGAPGGARQGISSSGFGLFGGASFPGTNLQGPAAVDGVQYGITSAADDPASGNQAVTGSNALIRSAVVFTLAGLPPGFDCSRQVSNVRFQYGTALNEPDFPGNPPLGACCAPEGTCVVTEESGCPAPNVWHPETTSCSPNPCPQPQGACCFPDGSCAYVLSSECPTDDWRMLVPCAPNPCPRPQGACCLPDGSCAFVLHTDCPTDDWRMLVPCEPNPCDQPQGACCFADGTCAFVVHSNCGNGLWTQGIGCDPNPCPQPPGVCCRTETGECLVLTQADCSAPDVWHPEILSCSPNPCPQPVPSDRTSWGRIKSGYR